MEKFSAWRDKGTGIAPFIPLSTPKTSIKKYVLDPVLLVVKLPLFFVLYWLSVVTPKAAIKTILSWSFGISLDISVAGVRKLNISEIHQAQPDKNSIVVSNFTSPLDIFVIFLSSKVSSLSAVTVLVPIDNTLYILTPWQVAWWCFQPIGLKCGIKLTSENEKNLKNKLVVVFAEGTTSNNRAVLSMNSVIEPLFSMSGFKYQTTLLLWYPNTVSTPIPIKTPFLYLCGLLTLSSGSYVKVKITPNDKGSLSASRAAYQENGVNLINLGAADKKKFFEYYQTQQK